MASSGFGAKAPPACLLWTAIGASQGRSQRADGGDLAAQTLFYVPDKIKARSCFIGNRAGALVCWGTKKTWDAIQVAQANDDLQPAARRAYLTATGQLAETAGEPNLAKTIATEIAALKTWTPDTPLGSLDALLRNPGEEQARRPVYSDPRTARM